MTDDLLDPDVQIIGIQVLSELATKLNELEPKRLPVSGAAASITIAMTKHSNDAVLSMLACNAFDIMTKDAKNKSCHASIQKLYDLMSKHQNPTNGSLRESRAKEKGKPRQPRQEKDTNFATFNVPENTPEVIVSAMKAHPNEEALLVFAMRALRNLCFNENSKLKIVLQGSGE